MKLPSLVATLVFSSLASAFAITDADIAPAALVGKTLVFTIVNGGAPYATNGTWSGAFAASGNGFTATKITGDFVNISTTFSAGLNGQYTDVALAELVDGQKPATLTLYTMDGVGHYEASIQDVFGVSLNGTFTFASTTAKGPEIDVFQPKGSELTDGGGKKNFGTVLVTKTGAAKKFVIKNSGSAPLKNLAITIDGKNKSDFIVSSLKKDQLADGESTEFTVKFKPSAFGTRKAALHISSNDKNENPFDIKLTGNGAGIK
ncbi:MAG: choice-of-anchor D domain-containing protein [Luteolibacter sp.]|uniref:choice-of-anchor D domain-containing protein n=1 Tax=Luteolibacter sp. TaxID=1962973 RepID=UPI003267C480